MSDKFRQPVLHLIVGGGKPAGDIEPFIKNCQELGWEICVIATPEGVTRFDKDAVAELTGHVVRQDEQPEELYPLPPADAFAVVAATFDTINKWAYGNNDNLALRLLNEATGVNLPILAMPAPDPVLARHPAFTESLHRLRQWGVTVVYPPEQYPSLGELEGVPEPFPWHLAEQVVKAWTRFARLPAPGDGANLTDYPADTDYPIDTSYPTDRLS